MEAGRAPAGHVVARERLVVVHVVLPRSRVADGGDSGIDHGHVTLVHLFLGGDHGRLGAGQLFLEGEHLLVGGGGGLNHGGERAELFVVDGVFEELVGEGSADAAMQVSASGVVFHPATGIDAATVAPVQTTLQKRILRAFVARGLLECVFRTNVTGDFGIVTEDSGPS